MTMPLTIGQTIYHAGRTTVRAAVVVSCTENQCKVQGTIRYRVNRSDLGATWFVTVEGARAQTLTNLDARIAAAQRELQRLQDWRRQAETSPVEEPIVVPKSVTL